MKTDKKSPEFNDELKGQEKNRALRPLIAASLTALSMTGAYASEDLSPVVLTVEDTKGTLDQLAGQEIPNTDPVQTYPESGSAYSLTKVQEGGEKPEGDNIITKFTYDTDSKTMTPVYYKLELKQTTYGEGDAEKNVNINFPTAHQVSVKYNYDTTNQHERFSNSTDLSDRTVTGNFINYNVADGGAIYNNGNSAILGDINSNFINNSSWGLGGAIYNSGRIGNISGDFVTNSTTGDGGAVYNIEGSINSVNGQFLGNSAGGSGGAIYNNGSSINNITGLFIGNFGQ